MYVYIYICMSVCMYVEIENRSCEWEVSLSSSHYLYPMLSIDSIFSRGGCLDLDVNRRKGNACSVRTQSGRMIMHVVGVGETDLKL